jgi:hypothetical protein
LLVLGFGADEKVIYYIERLLWFVSQQRGKPVTRAFWPHEMKLLLARTLGLASRSHSLQYSPDETKNPTSNQAGWPEWTISPWSS